jgi:hypothetical protein
MPKSAAIYDPIAIRLSYREARSRRQRLVHEMTTLAVGCVAIAVISIGLVLVASPELRDGIISTYLAMDMPVSP